MSKANPPTPETVANLYLQLSAADQNEFLRQISKRISDNDNEYLQTSIVATILGISCSQASRLVTRGHRKFGKLVSNGRGSKRRRIRTDSVAYYLLRQILDRYSKHLYETELLLEIKKGLNLCIYNKPPDQINLATLDLKKALDENDRIIEERNAREHKIIKQIESYQKGERKEGNHNSIDAAELFEQLEDIEGDDLKQESLFDSDIKNLLDSTATVCGHLPRLNHIRDFLATILNAFPEEDD